MKILVTGGAGYIGSHFLKALKESKIAKNDDVLVIDNLENGHPENLIFGKFEKLDLRDPIAIENAVAKFKPDLIVHFAAYISVPESVKDPLKYYRNNVLGSLNLIDAAVKNDVNKFIFSSTAAVYGDTT
jgi:UDP-glucose 4-epimerase